MKFLLLITAVICLIRGEDLRDAFHRAMSKYAAKDNINLSESMKMTQKRYESFLKFHAMVEEINNDDSLPYRAADNFMSILTDEERKLHLGLNITGQLADISTNDDSEFVVSTSNSVIPETRDFSLVISDVKDQSSCGSCWTFGATAALEGEIYFKTGNKKVSLSEQEYMECVNNRDACRGGWPPQCYEYSANKDRIAPSSAYPYLNPSRDRRTCHADSTTANALVDNNVKVTGTVYFGKGDVKLLEKASTHIISVGIYANAHFQGYNDGMYVDGKCNDDSLNHAVNIVGYGKDSSTGQKYWKIRNSWGQDWGEKGYMFMDREKYNMCKISSIPHYPKVECRNGNCVAPNPDDGDSSHDEEDKDEEDDKDDEKDDEKDKDKEFGYDEACFTSRHISFCRNKKSGALNECSKGGLTSSECIVAKIGPKCFVGTTGAESDLRFVNTPYKCSNEPVRNSNGICYDKLILSKECKSSSNDALEICKAKVPANKCIIIHDGKCFYATNGWDNGDKFVQSGEECKEEEPCNSAGGLVLCSDCNCCKHKHFCPDTNGYL